jgi:hypothetical protein
MVWIAAFLVGGIIALLYWYSIRQGIGELALKYGKKPEATAVAKTNDRGSGDTNKSSSPAELPKSAPSKEVPSSGSSPTAASPSHGSTDSKIEQQLSELSKQLSQSRDKPPCDIPNGQFVGCSDAEVFNWGEPLIARLQAAVQENKDSMIRRNQQYAIDHDEKALNYKVMENAHLNRYLERDLKNLQIYRAALVSKLHGGSPNPEYALKSVADSIAMRGSLSDAISMYGLADMIAEDLQDLRNRLSQQLH